MTRPTAAITFAALLYAGVALHAALDTRTGAQATPEATVAASLDQPAAPAADGGAETTADAHNAVLRQYCVTCHNDRAKRGGLTLASFDMAAAAAEAETAEKIIHKLQARMMPPSGSRRPDAATLRAVLDSLVERVDAAAIANPNPGRRTFQRLNQAEYARSIRELLAIEVDVAAFLPPDTMSHGFDNIADAQTLSPTLMEGYLRAASRISRVAVGDPTATPSEATYKVPRTGSQMHHIEGTPFGTRGGIAVEHNFPADGEYVFRVELHPGPTGFLYGTTTDGEQIEISINGARVAVLDVDPFMTEADPTGMRMQTEPITVKAGPHRVAAAFISRFDGPVDDIMAPVEHTLADTQIGSARGITTLPHLRDLSIGGPFNVTGVSDTPSRRRIFSCRPTAPSEERACAEAIIERLATQAYRRPVDGADLTGLLEFYDLGRAERDFELGIRMALQAILASPHFVFRLEQAPPVAPGENYRIADVDLASRLSYFLWATPPDATLLAVAAEGGLREPAGLRHQVERMLADPRAEALASRFGAQLLRLQDLEKVHPDALLYPYYDATLGEAMQRETELFFEHLVREDRSVLELVTADYTFVDERLARHYDIPGVSGSQFRKVPLPDASRRGLLGHGSVLTLTSHANRTSPVLRGKWIMEVLLGSPPPPPPPDVPDLEDRDEFAGRGVPSVRELLEEHRANPACRSCHVVIDPLGLALENFDVTGKWRIRDNGAAIDPSGELYDGTPIGGPADIRRALAGLSDTVLTTFARNLMAYAVGRRIEYFDMPSIRAIVRDAAAQDHRFSAYVIGIVNSPAFQMSRMATDTTEHDEVH